MIDRGLLATLVVVVAVVAVLDRRLRRRVFPREPVLSLASTPLIVGFGAGRLAAVALDDPATLQRPVDLLLIRGGMEFWPGVAVAAAAVWLGSRRGPSPAPELVAELAPFAVWAYAAYEATCLLREGCFGPASPLGLRPGGLGQHQVPVGVVVGLAIAGLGVGVWRWSHGTQPATVVALAVVGVAAIRSVAGFALPKVTPGLSRPHRESLAVLALGVVWTVGWLWAAQAGRRRTGQDPGPERAKSGTAPGAERDLGGPDRRRPPP